MFRELLVYFFIALIGYGLDVSIYLMLIKMNFDVYFSYIFGLALGLSFNVVLLRRFFKKGRFGLLKDIWLTFMANGVVLILGFGLYAGLIAFSEIGPLLSKFLSNGITFSVNYILRKNHF